MTNTGDSSNEPPTATATAQASTPPVPGQAPTPSVAVEGSTTTSTGSEEPPGGGDSGGGAVAVSAGMAVLSIGPPSSTDRAKAGVGGRSSRGGVRLGQRKRARDQGHVAPDGSSCLKSHPERGWRGVSPPPAFSPDEFGDSLAQVGGGGTGEVAESAARAGGGEVGGAVGREASEAAVTVGETEEGQDGNLVARRPVFDLNELPEKEEVEEPSSSSSGKLDWDLNKTPSPGAAP